MHGCGYTADSLIRDDIGSVYVAYFRNDTRQHGLEVDLRRALSEEVRLHTGLTLAQRAEADSILEGELMDYSIISTMSGADDEILMKRINVGIRYRWLDGLSGRELTPWGELEESVLLAVGHQEAEAERAFREVAQALVQSLEREW